MDGQSILEVAVGTGMAFREILRRNPRGQNRGIDLSPGMLSRASRIYEAIYRLSPGALGGCRGVEMTGRLQAHGFAVDAREYHQQMLFPSEVVLARSGA